MMNNKGVSKILVVIIAIIIIAALVFAFGGFGGAPATAKQDVTVYIDKQQISGDYTQPQALNWGTVLAGNTYTKNFNVTNTGTQTVNLILLTTEPAGTSQSWVYNNTALPPASYSAGSLTLTLSAYPQTGEFSWRLIASNSSITSPTPTAAPSTTPQPNGYTFTIDGDSGIQNVTVTRNNAAAFTLLQQDLPKTYLYTEGDTLKFTFNLEDGYTFNGWQFSDGSMPTTTPTLIMTSTHGNFTVTATSILTPP